MKALCTVMLIFTLSNQAMAKFRTSEFLYVPPVKRHKLQTNFIYESVSDKLSGTNVDSTGFDLDFGWLYSMDKMHSFKAGIGYLSETSEDSSSPNNDDKISGIKDLLFEYLGKKRVESKMGQVRFGAALRFSPFKREVDASGNGTKQNAFTGLTGIDVNFGYEHQIKRQIIGGLINLTLLQLEGKSELDLGGGNILSLDTSGGKKFDITVFYERPSKRHTWGLFLVRDTTTEIKAKSGLGTIKLGKVLALNFGAYRKWTFAKKFQFVPKFTYKTLDKDETGYDSGSGYEFDFKLRMSI